ncbi:MAG: hypothetical protein ISS82_02885 [Nanoarchaeota archaeon]|nr:hypothetical protein [Nanoarchaeota archaeon]
MNKKGAYFISKELLLWIVRIFVITFVIIVVLSFLGQHINRQLYVDEIRTNILIERLYYSPDCFSYQDENGIKPGIIDTTKFNELTLNKCIKYSEELNGVGLTLNLNYEDNKNLVYINQRMANKFPAFCSDEKKFACYTKQNYVLIKDGSELKKGTLEINTIQIK